METTKVSSILRDFVLETYQLDKKYIYQITPFDVDALCSIATNILRVCDQNNEEYNNIVSVHQELKELKEWLQNPKYERYAIV
jgi:hypothetical protein